MSELTTQRAQHGVWQILEEPVTPADHLVTEWMIRHITPVVVDRLKGLSKLIHYIASLHGHKWVRCWLSRCRKILKGDLTSDLLKDGGRLFPSPTRS